MAFRAQSSLEALISFAALLSALAILVFSTQRLSTHFEESVQASSARISLSRQALLVESAAATGLPLNIQENLSGISFFERGKISSAARSSVSEPLFHGASTDSEGKLHVQKNPATPV